MHETLEHPEIGVAARRDSPASPRGAPLFPFSSSPDFMLTRSISFRPDAALIYNHPFIYLGVALGGAAIDMALAVAIMPSPH